MPSCCLLVAASDRARVPVEYPRASRQQRWELPRLPWLQALPETRAYLGSGQAPPAPVLAQVAEGIEYTGPLTPWDCFGWLQWVFHFKPTDAYTLKIHGRYLFPETLRAISEVVACRKTRYFIASFIGDPLDAAQGEVLMGDGDQSCGRWQRCSGAQARAQLGNLESWLSVPVLVLHPLLLHLIRQGLCSCLLQMLRWRYDRHMFRIVPGFPSEAWARSVPGAAFVDLPEREQALISRGQAIDLAATLRESASLLLAAEGEIAESKKLKLGNLVETLDSYAGLLPHEKSRARATSPLAVVKTLVLATELRDRAKIRTVMQHSLQLLFPGSELDTVGDFLLSRRAGKASISRYQTRVDAAYSAYWQQRLQSRPPAAIWLWMDFSPQAGEVLIYHV